MIKAVSKKELTNPSWAINVFIKIKAGFSGYPPAFTLKKDNIII